jgi:lysophospholipase L1-like esterase
LARNDTMVVDGPPFADAYREIVRRGLALGAKTFVVSLAPVANSGSLASAIDRSRWSEIRRTIRQTAEDQSVPLIDVSTLNIATSPVIEDGVHLSRDGYVAWTSTIESALSRQRP